MCTYMLRKGHTWHAPCKHRYARCKHRYAPCKHRYAPCKYRYAPCKHRYAPHKLHAEHSQRPRHPIGSHNTYTIHRDSAEALTSMRSRAISDSKFFTETRSASSWLAIAVRSLRSACRDTVKRSVSLESCAICCRNASCAWSSRLQRSRAAVRSEMVACCERTQTHRHTDNIKQMMEWLSNRAISITTHYKFCLYIQQQSSFWK